MQNLYDIADEFKKIQSLIDEGVDADAIKDTIECVEMIFSEKADNIAKVIRNNELYCESIASEIDRLKDKHSKAIKTNERLSEYLKNAMIFSGKNKFKSGSFDFSIRKGRASVKIENEDSIPDEFVSAKVVITPDKKAIKEAIEAGLEVPGASIIIGEDSLSIK